MDKNVQLTLTGRQQDPDGGSTVTEISAEAEYYERNGAVYILYDETAEDGGTIRNRIKLKDLLLEVTRKGAVNSCMVFETGREHMTEYITPLGVLHLDVRTHSVRAKQRHEELTVTADYTLMSEGREISRCELSIKIQNKG